jgi:hypothetical protein
MNFAFPLFNVSLCSLIKVPYFDPETFKHEDRDKFDLRDVEKIDPYFEVKRENTLRVRVGCPKFL